MAATVIERLLHQYHIANIRGNSYPMREHQQWLCSPAERQRQGIAMRSPPPQPSGAIQPRLRSLRSLRLGRIAGTTSPGQRLLRSRSLQAKCAVFSCQE